MKAAERAIKEVQGFELFEKPMILDYAKTPSDATVQREGTHEDFDSHKRRRLAEKGTYTYLPACLPLHRSERREFMVGGWLTD